MLAKAPGLTVVAVLTLALGIGASTASFSVVNALVLRELPVRDPGRLASFYTTRRNGQWAGITVMQLRELERQQSLFTGIFGRSYPDNSNVEDDGDIWPINLGKVTGQYYSVLGVRPALGRLITPDDAGISHGTPSAVAVIGYNFWQRRYSGHRDVIGKPIFIARKPFSIIGVTPKGFFGEQVGFALDVTIPITETPGAQTNFPHGPWCQYGVGRLRNGVSLDQARAELEAIWPTVRAASIPSGLTPAQLSDVQAEQLRIETYPKNGYSYLRDQFSKPLYVLAGVSGLTLLIACVNLAVLLLAHSSARRHELAIRIALGASRWRVMRQLLTESLTISISGAVLGMGLAAWASKWLVSFWRHIPFNPPTVIDLKPDLRVLLFAAAVAVLTGILFGLAPAWHGSRGAPAGVLQESSHAGGGNMRRVGKFLITAQVALSLMLVAAGGLLVRSLEKIRDIRPGFDYRAVAVLQLQGDAGGNTDYGDTYYQNLVRQVSELPGVQSVALSQMVPGAGFGGTETVGRSQRGNAVSFDADSQVISPEFFQTMKIPFVQGRDFTWQDNERTPRVAVISRSLAQRLFPEGEPVGQFIRIGNETERQNVRVVGVVNDARVKDIRSSSRFAVYTPFLQEPKYWTNVEIRAAGP
ncbi:MAG: ABC transporter permease, partial [Candidatus Acidiferrales bacterium]